MGLSAINGLDGAVLRKKDKEYNWRKEMDDYEKRAEYERDVRARNVSALHRNADPEEDHWVTQRNQVDRKRQTKEVIEKPIEKAAKKEVAVKTDSEPVKSWRERREAERKTEIIEPEPERKSWREKLAEKQAKEEEEKKQKEADVAAAQAAVAEAKQRAEAAAADASADNKTANAAESTADGEKGE